MVKKMGAVKPVMAQWCSVQFVAVKGSYYIGRLYMAYGIPPEQMVGSSVKTQFEMRDGKPVLMRLPELNFNDDQGGKPVSIHEHIGRRPIAAFGNSDGDLQMLQYTGAGNGTRFCLYVHHDDAAREYTYDRTDHLAKLDKGLDEANIQHISTFMPKLSRENSGPHASTGIAPNE